MPTRPLYKVVFDPDDPRLGLECVSLVDEPAIEVDFVKLQKQEPMAHIARFSLESLPEKATDGEKQWVTGPILIPDQKIFRIAPDGTEFDLVYERETIRQMAEGAAKTGSLRVLTKDHDGGAPLEAYMVETWLSDDAQIDKARNLGFDLPAGTWFVTYKIPNRRAWDELIVSGRVKGFSIEAMIATQHVEQDAAPEREEQRGEPMTEKAFWESKRQSFIRKLKAIDDPAARKHLNKLKDEDGWFSHLKNNYGKIEELVSASREKQSQPTSKIGLRAKIAMGFIDKLRAALAAPPQQPQQPAPQQAWEQFRAKLALVKQQEEGDAFIILTPVGPVSVTIIDGLAVSVDVEGMVIPAGVYEGMKILGDELSEDGWLTVDENGVPTWSTEMPEGADAPEGDTVSEEMRAKLRAARIATRQAAAKLARQAAAKPPAGKQPARVEQQVVTYMLEGDVEVAILDGDVVEIADGSGLRLPAGVYPTTSGVTLYVNDAGVVENIAPTAAVEGGATSEVADDLTEEVLQERIRADQRRLLALRQRQQKTPAVKNPLPPAAPAAPTRELTRLEQNRLRIAQLEQNPELGRQFREKYNPTLHPKKR